MSSTPSDGFGECGRFAQSVVRQVHTAAPSASPSCRLDRTDVRAALRNRSNGRMHPAAPCPGLCLWVKRAPREHRQHPIVQFSAPHSVQATYVNVKQCVAPHLHLIRAADAGRSEQLHPRQERLGSDIRRFEGIHGSPSVSLEAVVSGSSFRALRSDSPSLAAVSKALSCGCPDFARQGTCCSIAPPAMTLRLHAAFSSRQAPAVTSRAPHGKSGMRSGSPRAFVCIGRLQERGIETSGQWALFDRDPFKSKGPPAADEISCNTRAH